MRNFILGILFIIIAVIVGVTVGVTFGLFPTAADATPPEFERHTAMRAVDASTERNAPRLNNPLPATDENLIAGLNLYDMNCSLCHGTLDKKPSALEKSFYPPVPQLILDPPEDPEWHTFYTIRTGIRYTGMPAWNKALSEPEMWKIAAFLSHLDKLPPAVQDYWKKTAAGSEGSSSDSQQEEGKSKHPTAVPPAKASNKAHKHSM